MRFIEVLEALGREAKKFLYGQDVIEHADVDDCERT
jgi:hypothetical protein